MYCILLRPAESGKIRKVFCFSWNKYAAGDENYVWRIRDEYEMNKMAHLTFAKIEIRKNEIRNGNRKKSEVKTRSGDQEQK